jgi:hypothetical protein
VSPVGGVATESLIGPPRVAGRDERIPSEATISEHCLEPMFLVRERCLGREVDECVPEIKHVSRALKRLRATVYGRASSLRERRPLLEHRRTARSIGPPPLCDPRFGIGTEILDVACVAVGRSCRISLIAASRNPAALKRDDST